MGRKEVAAAVCRAFAKLQTATTVSKPKLLAIMLSPVY